MKQGEPDGPENTSEEKETEEMTNLDSEDYSWLEIDEFDDAN